VLKKTFGVINYVLSEFKSDFSHQELRAQQKGFRAGKKQN
jgi:hypothetical protein